MELSKGDALVVKLWRRGEYTDELAEYWGYVYLAMRLFEFPELDWRDNEFSEGWSFTVGYNVPGLDEYVCAVVYYAELVDGARWTAASDEDVRRAVDEGRVIDYTPNEQRMREYRIYKWWLEFWRSRANRIGNLLEEIGRLI